MDPTTLAYVLMLMNSTTTNVAPLDVATACVYEDGSELTDNGICWWDGAENSYVATRTIDADINGESFTQINYIYIDGHLEKGTWEQ